MEKIFQKIGLAVTFSPTGKALLKEAVRLRNLFLSELSLIHVGEKNDYSKKMISELIEDSGLVENQINLVWSAGDPAKEILKFSELNNLDLLISGALEKENILKFYLGSVARKIMREASMSTLILKSPSINPTGFKKICVNVNFSEQSEKTVKTAYQLALADSSDEFILVRDFNIPGLTSTTIDFNSAEKIDELKNEQLKSEEYKLQLLVKELGLKGVKIKTKCIYGIEGWASSDYARQHAVDLFVVSTQKRKLKFIDRIFPHEEEFSYENLPSNLLIIR
ncbi:MAG TPA: universal stress protein [Ignavibacteriaceae bacterium]|nr:universal stress protein [Ignavibacteriaceae bacterium]